MEHALYTIVGGIIAAIAYRIGWNTGRQYGRDEQFNDDFIAQGRRDAARRDRNGRFTHFRSSNTQMHTPHTREG